MGFGGPGDVVASWHGRPASSPLQCSRAERPDDDPNRCEKDAGKLVSDMYSNFQNAMRDEFTLDRPAQPFLYVNGTGGS